MSFRIIIFIKLPPLEYQSYLIIPMDFGKHKRIVSFALTTNLLF